MKLRPVLFWDTDYDSVSFEAHAPYVIERVARYGTWDEWKELLAYYGEERVKDEVIRLRDLDPKTLHFLSIRFEVPKEQFRCYTQQAYNPKHYSF